MPDAATLSQADQEAWTAFVQAGRLLTAQLDRDLRREAGLPSACYELLSLLACSPAGALRMSELAAATQSSPSRITHTMDRMASRGWIERKGCAGDRRGCSASLTEAGHKAVELASITHDSSVRTHLLAHLSPGQAGELSAIGRAILQHLSSVRAR